MNDVVIVDFSIDYDKTFVIKLELVSDTNSREFTFAHLINMR